MELERVFGEVKLTHTEGTVFTFQARSALAAGFGLGSERVGGVAGQAIPGGTTRARLTAPVGGSTRPLAAKPTALTLIMTNLKKCHIFVISLLQQVG